MYQLLAKIVVLTHVIFVVWVLIGGFLAQKNGSATVFHLGCLLYGMVITWYGFPCPLTDLEKLFLSLAGEPVYAGEFLPHYLWSQFNIGQSTILAVVMLAVLLGVNIIAYFPLVKAKLRRNTKS